MELCNLTQLKRGDLPLSEYQDIINARMRGVISTFKSSDGVIYYDRSDYIRYKLGGKKGRTLLNDLLRTVPAGGYLIISTSDSESPEFSGPAGTFKSLPEYHDYYSSRVLSRALPIKMEDGQPALLIYYI